jgi:DNA modification methylase
MEDKSVDCIISDPPYGVELDYGEHYEDSFANWKNLIDAFLPEALRVSRGVVIIPTSKLEGEKYLHNLNPLWRICWFKGASATRSPIGFKDWETAFVFGNKPPRQLHDYFTVHANNVRVEVPEHPCPKPTGWALWMVEKMSNQGDLVLDPFMGSGTTGIACVKLKRDFIGIELDGEFYKLAQRRIQNAQADMGLADKILSSNTTVTPLFA